MADSFLRFLESHCPRFERVECYSQFFLSVFVIEGSSSLLRVPFSSEPKVSPTEIGGVGNCAEEWKKFHVMSGESKER